MSKPERCIILSHGRCGSTLLSNLIASDTETLSVQESLESLMTAPWGLGEKITGLQYWELLSAVSPQWKAAVRIGAMPSEFRYPADGRWAGRLSELPFICQITLPALSDDPDSLFDLLARRTPRFPVQTLALHHQTLLDLLASLQGRRRWVERTGASSRMADSLLREFPAAKVVYLTRNAADTALSMSRHPAYRFTAIRLELLHHCGFDPYREFAWPGPHAGDRRIPDELRCLLPEQLSAQALEDVGGSLEQHKLLCAFLTYMAERALAEHPPRQLLRMRYEDLVAEPAEQLTRLGGFLGFADPDGWAARAAVRVSRPQRTELPAGPAARADPFAAELTR
jgi:putative sulfotransferase